MKTPARIVLIAILAGIIQPGMTVVLPSVFPQFACTAYAEDWKKEFDEICQKTTDSMSLSKDELRQLISRCDKLRKVIETLGETEKKVNLKRLRACQDLFVFVLESKEKQ